MTTAGCRTDGMSVVLLSMHKTMANGLGCADPRQFEADVVLVDEVVIVQGL